MIKTTSDRAALLLYPKRFWLLTMTVLMLSAGFWSTSRYPHLLHLAETSAGFVATSLVAPQPLLAIVPDTSYLESVALNTVNWLYANRIGMGFGLVLGALLLTLLQTVGRPRSTNTYLNTAYGIALGAPLGVCVNCAAPIAAGMSRGGSALVTSLSTMFSAPTLNVIALVMTFSLFPVQLGLIKLVLSLVFLLATLPWLARRFSDVPRSSGQLDDASCALPTPVPRLNEPWQEALKCTGSALIANAWFLVRLTVPLMIAAGFLGAAVTSAIPVGGFVAIDVSIAGMLMVATVGLLLPMPIVFDVMLSQALYTAGLPLPYVGCLLFTLGIHSVFSFAVVARMHSLRLANAIFMVLIVLGLISGLLGVVVS